MDALARATGHALQKRRAAWTVLVLLAGSSCGGGAPALRAWEELDDATGTTVRRAAAPLVFASDDPARAANARDYIAVAPLEVIRGTQHGRWLWLAVWSTIDRRVTNGDPELPELLEVRLVADGEPVDVDFGAAVGSVPGAGQGPYAAPVRSARIHFVPVTASQLARVGRASAVELAVTRAGEAEQRWGRWSGEAADVAALAALVGGQRALGGGTGAP